MGNHEEPFPQIHSDRLVNPGDDDDDPWAFLRLGLPEAEVHDPLVLLHHLDCCKNEDQDNDHEKEEYDEEADHAGSLEREHRSGDERDASDSPHTTSPAVDGRSLS